jgi:hypothetical protein
MDISGAAHEKRKIDLTKQKILGYSTPDAPVGD